MRQLLSAEGLDREFQGKPVLRDAAFYVDDGEKVGLIGANGTGKTTLLRIITGEVRPDAGEVRLRGPLRVASMAQHFSLPLDTVVREALASTEDWYLMPGQPAKRTPRSAPDEAWRKLADRLSITEAMQARTVAELSGGERTKIAVVRALLAADGVDLLLLDEPTSHLDIPTMEWLERAVSGLRCAALVVSHDRYFLDRTVTRIVELDGGALTSFPGNYTAYAARKEAAARELEARYRKQQQEIASMRASVEEMRRRWAYDPGRYRQKERALERMNVIEAPRCEASPAMDFAHESKIGREMLVFDGVTFERDGRTILDDISFTIENGEKIGLIGANGSGKSTIAKLIMRRLEPTKGRVRVVGKTVPGYFAQEHEGLDPGATALDEISRLGPSMEEKTVRGMLAMMRLGRESAYKLVSKLSGGERARLALLKLVLSPTNLLVLDEPTNYLDAASRQAFEDALLGYDGAALIITHDRYLLDRVATRIFAVDAGRLETFPGNYTQYISRRRVPLGRGGRNRYVVAKNYTDWSTRTKYKVGQIVELTPEQEDAQRWAIENKALVPKDG